MRPLAPSSFRATRNLIRPNGRIPGLRVRHINGISSAHGPAGPKRPRAMNRNGGPEAPHPNGTTPIDAAERGIEFTGPSRRVSQALMFGKTDNQ